MIDHDIMQAISQLDLNPIKFKLMHKQSGEGWSLAQADAAEVEYRRFLYLMKAFPNASTAPNEMVDTFWHYHILDTRKYAEDCAQAFGYFLHHYPYVGMGDAADAAALEKMGEHMGELYEASFDVPYAQAGAAFCAIAPSQQAAFCAIAPSQKAAFCAIAPSQKAAFCAIAPSQQAAFCAVPSAQQVAFCARTLQKNVAFCATLTEISANMHANLGLDALASSGKPAPLAP